MRKPIRMAAVLVAALGVAACGSDNANTGSQSSPSTSPTPTTSSASSTSAAPTTSSATSSSTGGDPVAAAKARLDGWYTGTDRALPTSAPKPQSGKNVWVIPCAAAAEGCAIPASAIKDAGGKVGWKVTVFDGGFDPTVQSNGIRSAIADHADAIVLIAVDCPNVSTAVQAAKDAGIKLYSDFSLDCNEGGTGGPKQFDGWAAFSPDMPQYSAYLHDVRARVATDWAIAKAGANANVLLVDQSDLVNSHIETAAFKEWFSNECPSCNVSTVEFTGPDLLSGNLRNIVAAALSKDPSVQVVVAPYDASITLGIGPAVTQTGRNLLVLGYEGLSANMAEIKKGGPTNLSTGFPSQWVGWQTVDQLNRLFNNQPLVDQGMGFQAVDKDHNVPAVTTFYDGNVDASGQPRQNYQTNFLKIWAVG
jgi:ribose transport system substrate-binding protein